jgi:hypothetical protein
MRYYRCRDVRRRLTRKKTERDWMIWKETKRLRRLTALQRLSRYIFYHHLAQEINEFIG